MEITKEKLIECGFKVFATYGDNYQMDRFINGCRIRIDRVSNEFLLTTDFLERRSFIPLIDFNRLNAIVYGITGEWLEEKVLMPKKLTAENGAKYALGGEFKEEFETIDDDGDPYISVVYISWDNIKSIYQKAVNHFTNE